MPNEKFALCFQPEVRQTTENGTSLADLLMTNRWMRVKPSSVRLYAWRFSARPPCNCPHGRGVRRRVLRDKLLVRGTRPQDDGTSESRLRFDSMGYSSDKNYGQRTRCNFVFDLSRFAEK